MLSVLLVYCGGEQGELHVKERYTGRHQVGVRQYRSTLRHQGQAGVSRGSTGVRRVGSTSRVGEPGSRTGLLVGGDDDE